jgi:dipeptidyl aminopeptidase/acylaminoacyl peptidase
MKIFVPLLALALCFSLDAQQTNNRAQSARRRAPAENGVYKARLTPHWFAGGEKFWYRNDLPGGAKEFILVDAEKGARRNAFDHAKLAAALSKAAGHDFKADHLPFSSITLSDDAKTVQFDVDTKTWECDLDTYVCKEKGASHASQNFDSDVFQLARTGGSGGIAQSPFAESETETQEADDDSPQNRSSRKSPDGKWTATVRDGNIFVHGGDGAERQLAQDGSTNAPYGLLEWSPDSSVLVAWRIEPGEHKEVFNIESSPPGGGRAKLKHRPYPQAGDRFAHYELNLFDIAGAKASKPKIDYYEHEWEPPRIHWLADRRRFAYSMDYRGHQRFRIVAVDCHSGETQDLVDEKTDTFIWTMHTEMLNVTAVNWLNKSDEMIFVSERDGWRHLYLIDTKTGALKNQITKGQWVVRGLDKIDEDARQAWFRAGGMNPGEDPYFVHYYRINFDGTGLVSLAEGEGMHTAQFSDNYKYLIDTVSRVDSPPVHNLRNAADGKLICELEKADISELKQRGWQPPEVFVAKGRDGRADIWGVIYRPKNFDPAAKYAVLEDIYAGPQGAFVPKAFGGAQRESSLTDLGFVVVQIDGMGTAFRSKAFHDVCWHNLKDAGFPDRILWHKALAAKYPWYDISRVGIFGTSAGGQSAAAAVLFHPEFYKAAIANCGCHDNRIDKASWNEQWMGYPVGPQYSDNSNIDNASRLKGKLFLIVGEMDSNVPPESTLRFVDALIKARKDFDLLVAPGEDHGVRGPDYPYVQRRMQDFFVKNRESWADRDPGCGV